MIISRWYDIRVSLVIIFFGVIGVKAGQKTDDEFLGRNYPAWMAGSKYRRELTGKRHPGNFRI